MNSREDSEMLELCESEVDDLKTLEVQKQPESPKSLSVMGSEVNHPILESHENQDDEMQKLYTSMGINLKDSDTVSHIRLDTIHIHGLEEMSTKDVYEFFSSMKPMTLEWINDSACNVVLPDKNSAAKALLELTHSEEIETMETDVKKSSSSIPEGKEDNEIVIVEEDDDDDDVQEGSEDGELPEEKEKKEPNYKMIWRKANKETDKQLKFRFATWDDKKIRGAEKFSEYYRKHGNPNFGGLKGLISGSLKRKMRQEVPAEPNADTAGELEDDHSSEDNEQTISNWSTGRTEERDPHRKRPKMKMYADEEERKSQKIKSSRILNRLGNVTVNVSLEEEKEDDYDELEISSPQEFGSKSVWDRLQVEVSNTQYSHRTADKKSSHRTRNHDTQRDLRKKLQTIRNNKKDHTSPLLLTSSSNRVT